MIEFAFWAVSGLIIYVYAGYPIVLWLVTRNTPPREWGEDLQPKVTLIISAFNEESCIAEKLDNSADLDYPVDMLEVIVVSDASSDGTDEIVTAHACSQIRLLRMNDRGGKTLGLNAGVAEAKGDIVVFSDANAMYDRSAIKALVKPFNDLDVGAVVGEAAYDEPETEAGRSESLYWRYETAIKEMESAKGSVVGGDGAIYAVRRALYVPMPADALSDFVNPLQVIQAGFSCVYTRDALSFENTAEEFDKEYRRKIRIVNRAWRAMVAHRAILNPFRYGLFSLKMWSHKVFRWLVPFLLVAVFAMNILLLGTRGIYTVLLLLQLLFYVLAFLGAILRNKTELNSIIGVPYYFCLVNLASARGIVQSFSGQTYTTWSTARVDGSEQSPPDIVRGDSRK